MASRRAHFRDFRDCLEAGLELSDHAAKSDPARPFLGLRPDGGLAFVGGDPDAAAAVVLEAVLEARDHSGTPALIVADVHFARTAADLWSLALVRMNEKAGPSSALEGAAALRGLGDQPLLIWRHTVAVSPSLVEQAIRATTRSMRAALVVIHLRALAGEESLGRAMCIRLAAGRAVLVVTNDATEDALRRNAPRDALTAWVERRADDEDTVRVQYSGILGRRYSHELRLGRLVKSEG